MGFGKKKEKPGIAHTFKTPFYFPQRKKRASEISEALSLHLL